MASKTDLICGREYVLLLFSFAQRLFVRMSRSTIQKPIRSAYPAVGFPETKEEYAK